MNERVSYWLETADYDLETARAMLETRRYLYVGFMCHLVIEKALKAVIAGTEVEPPRSHRLRRLAGLAGIFGQMDDAQRQFLELLEPLNIETRCPGEMEQIASRPDEDRCRALERQTRELYEWRKARL